MAAVSALQPPKRKKNVYGKSGGSGFNTAHLSSFFDEDDLAVSKPTIGRHANLDSTYTVQKTEARPHKLKPARPRAKRQDTFDVPSSDDEIQSPAKIVSLPEYRPQLYDDTDTSSAQLAPWEKKKVSGSQQKQSSNVKSRKTPEGSPDAQLKRELARATSSPEDKHSKTFTPQKKSPATRASPVSSPEQNHNANAGSALARLAARKRFADGSAASSADELTGPNGKLPGTSEFASEKVETGPRKRVKVHSAMTGDIEDVVMADATSVSTPLDAAQNETAQADVNVYDFPESSSDEKVNAKVPKRQTKDMRKANRRGKLSAYSRSAARKGISAPARLTEMIATDTDTTDAPTRSPSLATSRRSTPQRHSTPPSGRMASPETAVKATGTMTPKQANLWNRLLPSDPVAPSPSTLPIKDLRISGQRRNGPTSFSRRLTKSQSDIPRRRTRLVDRLKASAPSSDYESTNESEDGGVEDINEVEPEPDPAPKASEQIPNLPRQTSQSQSQSQSTGTGGSGPKITYGQARSYLPEDNLEEDLMLGFVNDTAQYPGGAGRGNIKASAASQKSAFDLDDSEDEGGTGKMRSIHELRASGSNARGMGEIEDLLDEIAKHNVSNRSSRRTALITLATSLMDKSFKGRFISQSCEPRLATECRAYPDEIAEFLLTAAIALLLSSSPPEHAVRSLHEQGILTWLAQLLEKDVEISKLAKERRSNMSKASHSSLMEFVDKLKVEKALWEDDTPASLSPRLIALKAMDELIRSLRVSGDRSEIMNGDQLRAVLHNSVETVNQSKDLEVALTISILESLSTTSLSLDWPSKVLNDISRLLPGLNSDRPVLRHARFLALRLCLNLTNDNVRNCSLLVQGSANLTVHYLLQAMKTGFEELGAEEDPEKRTMSLDLLVLATGIMINLSEHCDDARIHTLGVPDLLATLVDTFLQGQKHMLEAESVEESVTNVTFGYLAVMLANLCQYAPAKAFVASQLPGQNLSMLTEAVEEFVRHHQKVDTMNFEGEDGAEIWSLFTEKLKVVLARLKDVEQAD